MLKRRITATEYRGMSTTAQSIYQQDGHGGYELDLENDDAETKRELDATRAELRETKKPLTWCKENLGGGNDPEVRLSSYRAAVDRAETSVLMTKAEFRFIGKSAVEHIGSNRKNVKSPIMRLLHKRHPGRTGRLLISTPVFVEVERHLKRLGEIGDCDFQVFASIPMAILVCHAS